MFTKPSALYKLIVSGSHVLEEIERTGSLSKAFKRLMEE